MVLGVDQKGLHSKNLNKHQECNEYRRCFHIKALSSSIRCRILFPVIMSGVFPITSFAFTPVVDSVNSSSNEIIQGGTQEVNSGGVAIGNTIESSGMQNVNAGGEANSTTINTYGDQNVNAGGVANGSIINEYGQQSVNSGGIANDTVINNYGNQYVNAGGVANNSIGNIGYQTVLAGGVANQGEFSNTGLQNVYGEANGTKIYYDSWQNIYAGGVANNTELFPRAGQRVEGVANSAKVGVDSWQDIRAGGVANDTEVQIGGWQNTFEDGTANRSIIYGAQYVKSGGTVVDTQVDGGFSQLNDGAISQGYFDVINGGTVEIESSSGQSSTIDSIKADGSSQVKLTTNNAFINSGSNTFVNITNLENNGTLSFSSAVNGDTTPINSFDPITLNVGSLSGNGVYAMHADIGNQIGDLIKVDQVGHGSINKLFIANNGSSNAQKTDKLTVVQTNSGGTANQFTLGSKVEQGGYEFGLYQEGNDWVLATPNSGGAGGGAGLTTTAQAAGNFLNISYLMTYINTQNLMQRMGDLRNTDNNKEVDIWIRGFAGKLDSFSSKMGDFNMNYRGTQMGADRLFNFSSGSLRAGLAVGYTDANPNYRDGNGNAKNYNFALYGTFVTDNQFYVDTVLKYEHIKNNFNVRDTQYNKVSGHAKSDGYGLSVEAGKRFYLQGSNEGLYLEPQLQASYMHQEGDVVRASNGLRVKLSDYSSLLGRASTALGYQIKNGDTPINVYLKTGYVKEFKASDVNYYLNSSKEKHSFKGSFWDSEIGISTTLNKRHTIYADLNYANGSRFDKQQINIGYRYTF